MDRDIRHSVQSKPKVSRVKAGNRYSKLLRNFRCGSVLNFQKSKLGSCSFDEYFNSTKIRNNRDL